MTAPSPNQPDLSRLPPPSTPSAYAAWQPLPYQPPRAEPLIVWRVEALIGVIVAAYSVFVGAGLGLFWQAHSPKIDLVGAINGAAGTGRALIGDDVRIGLFGIVAGILVAGIAAVAAGDRGRGPGLVLGLAVGGVLGSIVAARVGVVANGDTVASTLRHLVPGVSNDSIDKVRGYFGYRVRARGVLLGWPIAAVAVSALITNARSRRAANRVELPALR